MLLFFGSVAAHIIYVNVFGKEINFAGWATSLSNSSQKITGAKLNLGGTASALSSASRGFGVFTGTLFAPLRPQAAEVSGLSPEEQNLLNSINIAMRDGRLFFPPFHSAELYLLELNKVKPESEIVNKKAIELLNLSHEKTLEFLKANQANKAHELITETARILPLVKDKTLHVKHQQISSSVMIAL